MPSLPDFVNRLAVGAAWTAAFLFSAAGLLLALDGLAGFVSHRPFPHAADLAQLLGLWGACLPLAFLYSAGRIWSPQHFAGPAGKGASRQRALKPGPRLVQCLVVAVALAVAVLGSLQLGSALAEGPAALVAALALPAGFLLLALQATADASVRPPAHPQGPSRRAPR